MIKDRKSVILEKRISRLEKLLKNESANSFEGRLDEDGARVAADRIIKQFGKLVNKRFLYEDLDGLSLYSPMYGWLSLDDTEEIEEDPDTRFVFQYGTNGYTAMVIPSDNAVELMTDGGYAVDPSNGSTFEADCPQDGAFNLAKWRRFDLSMVYSESVKRPIKRTTKH